MSWKDVLLEEIQNPSWCPVCSCIRTRHSQSMCSLKASKITRIFEVLAALSRAAVAEHSRRPRISPRLRELLRRLREGDL